MFLAREVTEYSLKEIGEGLPPPPLHGRPRDHPGGARPEAQSRPRPHHRAPRPPTRGLTLPPTRPGFPGRRQAPPPVALRPVPSGRFEPQAPTGFRRLPGPRSPRRGSENRRKTPPTGAENSREPGRSAAAGSPPPEPPRTTRPQSERNPTGEPPLIPIESTSYRTHPKYPNAKNSTIIPPCRESGDLLRHFPLRSVFFDRSAARCRPPEPRRFAGPSAPPRPRLSLRPPEQERTHPPPWSSPPNARASSPN